MPSQPNLLLSRASQKKFAGKVLAQPPPTLAFRRQFLHPRRHPQYIGDGFSIPLLLSPLSWAPFPSVALDRPRNFDVQFYSNAKAEDVLSPRLFRLRYCEPILSIVVSLTHFYASLRNKRTPRRSTQSSTSALNPPPSGGNVAPPYVVTLAMRLNLSN